MALEELPNGDGGPFHDRDDWAALCAAVKGAGTAAGVKEEAWEAFCDWSSQWGGDPAETERVWDTFAPRSGWGFIMQSLERVNPDGYARVKEAASNASRAMLLSAEIDPLQVHLLEMDLGASTPTVTVTKVVLKFEAASCFANESVPLREWLVQDMVPMNVVTMLGGDGGTGKSLLALQLAVAATTGRQWLGRQIEQPGRVMVVSAEDDRSELHRRIAAICARENVGWAELSGLLLRSLAGDDALLANVSDSRVFKPTVLYKALDAAMAQHQPKLLVLDTLADLFPGNENDRAQVRQFIGLLRILALKHGCGALAGTPVSVRDHKR